MATSYPSNNNFEPLHATQPQPRHSTDPKKPSPQPVITDVAQLENADPCVTTKVVAALLGMSVSAVKKMRQRKQGPDLIKTESGAVRYLLSAVLAYRAKRTVHH